MKPSIETLYQQFHAIPELGWQEYETTELIHHYMKSLAALKSPLDLFDQETPLGLPHSIDTPYKIGETGAIYQFDTQKTGPTFVFRFDIDGLPIEENPNHLIHSKFHNQMHACGHDLHTCLGIRLSYIIHENLSELSGKFIMVFQPAEEGLRGGYHFSKHPWLENADYIISQHVGIIKAETPTIGLSVKGSMGSVKLDLSFKGKSSHAALSPEDGKNALLCAIESASEIMDLRDGNNRINIGTLNGGSSRNIIPDQAFIEMEYRCTTEADLIILGEKIESILVSYSEKFDVKIEISKVGYAPPLLVDHGNHYSELAKSSGFKKILNQVNFLASEDFSHYKGKEKHYFIMSDHGTLPHHHADFAMPLSIIEKGEKFLFGFIVSKLKIKKR